jgi:protein Xni
MLYDDYKFGRKPTPEVLISNLDRFRRAFETAGVRSLEVAGYEADDVIATLAAGVANSSGDAIILSTDKGFLSLLDKHIEVYHHFEQHFLTSTDVRVKYALRHDQLIDYWSLSGDPGNNIKGVPGVGKKTALLLLEKFDSLDEVLAQARGLAQDQAADSGLAVYQKSLSKVLQFEDEAEKCRLLLTPKLDVELGINLKIFRLG